MRQQQTCGSCELLDVSTCYGRQRHVRLDSLRLPRPNSLLAFVDEDGGGGF